MPVKQPAMVPPREHSRRNVRFIHWRDILATRLWMDRVAATNVAARILAAPRDQVRGGGVK